jgi:hypothetical protein
MNSRNRSIAVALLLLAPALPMSAQANGVWLMWTNASVLLYPDSSGVFFRFSVETPSRRGPFSATFDPSRVAEWLPVARGVNNQPIHESDISNVRTTPMLQSLIGDAIRIVRRRENGVWTKERFIVMESIKDTQPLVFIGGERSVGQIIDSLEAVSARTRFSKSAAQQEISETLLVTYDKEASASPRNLGPGYPLEARRSYRNGMVITSFYVDEKGRVDMATARTLFASAPAFADAVTASLVNMVFDPAEKDGKKVRSKVTMPFAFSVIR